MQTVGCEQLRERNFTNSAALCTVLSLIPHYAYKYNKYVLLYEEFINRDKFTKLQQYTSSFRNAHRYITAISTVSSTKQNLTN